MIRFGVGCFLGLREGYWLYFLNHTNGFVQAPRENRKELTHPYTKKRKKERKKKSIIEVDSD